MLVRSTDQQRSIVMDVGSALYLTLVILVFVVFMAGLYWGWTQAH